MCEELAFDRNGLRTTASNAHLLLVPFMCVTAVEPTGPCPRRDMKGNVSVLLEERRLCFLHKPRLCHASPTGARWQTLQSHKVELVVVEQFPLQQVTRSQPDCCRQRQQKTQGKPWLLSLATNWLDGERINRSRQFRGLIEADRMQVQGRSNLGQLGLSQRNSVGESNTTAVLAQK